MLRKRKRQPQLRNYTHRTVIELVELLDEMIEDSNPLLFTKLPDSFYINRLKVVKIIKEMRE